MSGVVRPKIYAWAETALAAAVCVLLAAFVFRNHRIESLNWTFPYFSGAANLAQWREWRISPAEFEQVRSLSSSQYLAFRHHPTPDAIPNIHNIPGYVLVVWVARSIFFWMGEGNAVVWLQVLVHLGSVLLVRSWLATRLQRNALVLAYGANPLVIHIVTFPFYYFWSVIPSIVLVAIATGGARWRSWHVVLATLMLALATSIRPSTLFVSLLCLGAIAVVGKVRHGLFAVAAFAVIVASTGTLSGGASVWHPAFVGIGAFPNAEGIRLADATVYERYRAATGRQVSTDAIHGTFRDSSARSQFIDWERTEVLASLRQHPLRYVRNGAAFTLQAFGPGYVVGGTVWNLVTIGVGLLVFVLLCWSRQWFLTAGIFAYALAFTPYFPPIPAYLFGAYLLTVLALTNVVERRLDAAREGGGTT